MMNFTERELVFSNNVDYPFVYKLFIINKMKLYYSNRRYKGI